MSNFTFEDLDSLWGNDSAPDNQFVADGKHTAKVYASTDHHDGTDIVKFKYYFPSSNTSESESIFLAPNKVKLLKAKLLSLGLDIPNTASELPKVLYPVQGWVVEVDKKTNGKYRNYFVTKVISNSPEEKEAPKKSDPVDDDDLPF